MSSGNKKNEEIKKDTGEKISATVNGTDTSKYFTGLTENILNKLIADANSSANEYNSEKLYENYKNYYTDAARKASENAYGLASSLTGGYGNSYASSVAASAYDSYMNELAKKSKEIDDTAYERAKDSRKNMYDLLAAAKKQEDKNYEIYRDELADAEKDRKFAADEEQKLKNFAFDAAKLGDYSYLEDLGVNTSKAKYLDAADIKNDELQKAKLYAQFGDYSALKSLGINTDKLQSEDKRELAELFAKYNDYSGLKDIGIDTGALEEKALTDKAKLYAQFGDYSGLKALGVDIGKLNKDELTELAQIYAKYGDYSLLRLLGVDISTLLDRDEMQMLLDKAKYYRYYR